MSAHLSRQALHLTLLLRVSSSDFPHASWPLASTGFRKLLEELELQHSAFGRRKVLSLSSPRLVSTNSMQCLLPTATQGALFLPWRRKSTLSLIITGYAFTKSGCQSGLLLARRIAEIGSGYDVSCGTAASDCIIVDSVYPHLSGLADVAMSPIIMQAPCMKIHLYCRGVISLY